MEDELLKFSNNFPAQAVTQFLIENNIETTKNRKDNFIIFCNYVIKKNQKKIKKRSKIRKKLSKLM